MNQQYKDMESRAQQLEFKIRDLLDDKSHAISRSLISESKKLVQQLRSQQNARSLEDHVKGIIRLFEHARSNDQVMDAHHADFLLRSYEELMMGLRKFENY